METEGTIRFAYGLEPPEGPVTDAATLQNLRGWRAVFRRLSLLGQDAERYGGLGFGNLSARDTRAGEAFVITASQTSGAPDLTEEDLVRITHSDPGRFWVDAIGHQPPSSETLTHAMVYQADSTIGWVFHVHSPDIWQRAGELALPATAGDVPYGSPAMAAAVAELLAEHADRPITFVTLGHEDGVFACARSADGAAGALLCTLARSLT
jgi:L-ribulose-5-phosphate 4-epimerase